RRPGCRASPGPGGRHGFMAGAGPPLPDSGGYQVYSPAQARQIPDHAAVFRSHIDGALFELTPERAVTARSGVSSNRAPSMWERKTAAWSGIWRAWAGE